MPQSKTHCAQKTSNYRPEPRMKIESNIHCGHVLDQWIDDGATYIETLHDPQTCLQCHSHLKPHTAILLAGGYFEKLDGQPHLRLPGDQVFYREHLPHEDWFGKIPSRCLNIEPVENENPPQIAIQ